MGDIKNFHMNTSTEYFSKVLEYYSIPIIGCAGRHAQTFVENINYS